MELVRRFFRVGTKQTAQQDLINVLARTPLNQITPNVVSDIIAKHKVSAAGTRSLLKDLWRDAVGECRGCYVDRRGEAYLCECTHVLGLSTPDAEAVLGEAVSSPVRLLRGSRRWQVLLVERVARLDRLTSESLRLHDQVRAKLNSLHRARIREETGPGIAGSELPAGGTRVLASLGEALARISICSKRRPRPCPLSPSL